jgi:hypothetical protein
MEKYQIPIEFRNYTKLAISFTLFALSTQINPASNSYLEIWEFTYGHSIQQARDKFCVLSVTNRFIRGTLSFGLGE